jgi:energy-coupling factor transporter transmembrane protein EcfT
MKDNYKNLVNNSTISNDSNPKIVYFGVMIGIIFQSLAFIPLIYSIIQTKYTKNISFFFLIATLLSATGFFAVSLYKRYLLQAFIFFILVITIIFVIYLKFNYDGNISEIDNYMTEIKKYSNDLDLYEKNIVNVNEPIPANESPIELDINIDKKTLK